VKILVMRGHRYFGKRLVEQLLEEGEDVTLITRGRTSDPFGDRVGRIALDRGELRAGHPALGTGSWDVVYDQVCYEAKEARAACETFRDRAGRYVFVSSQSVYASGANLKESDFDPRAHRFEHEADRQKEYAEAKRQCEAVFAANAPFPLVAVRFPIVLGEDDYTGRLEFHVDRIKNAQAFAHPAPASRISFVHSADAGACLAWLRGVSATGGLNVASPDSIRLDELFARVAELTKGRVEISDAAEKSPFGIPEDWYMDMSRLRSLGFEPRPFDAWLDPLILELSRRSTP